MSNAWLIKCVGPPVFCAPNIGIGGYLGSAYAPVFVGSADNHPAMAEFQAAARFTTRATRCDSTSASGCSRHLESDQLDKDQQVKDWSDLREKTYDAHDARRRAAGV